MNDFRGQFEHQMDAKGRVSLPSAFRREAGTDRFVLIQWEPGYLTLFPEERWSEVEAKLLEYRRSGREAMNHVRVLLSNALEVSPDKQGRILVPSALQQAAGLDGRVLLLGNIDRIEMWDPESYEREVEGRADGFETFAYQVFG